MCNVVCFIGVLSLRGLKFVMTHVGTKVLKLQAGTGFLKGLVQFLEHARGTRYNSV